MPESRKETDIVPDKPPIPDEYPSDEGAEPEVHDAPLGTQQGDDEDGRMPGVPEGKEPPDAG